METRHIPDFRKTAMVLFLFAVAMGYLEAVIVVYLRELYYPEGFDFPLILLPERTVLIEYVRELATLVMLWGVGWLAGRNGTSRFGWFLYAFGIWDLFYYVTLKAVLGWPASLLTWDVLFLIPIVWAAPVLAPALNAVTMVAYGLVLNARRTLPPALSRKEWSLLVAGAGVVFFTFIRDYGMLLWQHRHSGQQKALLEAVTRYVPEKFAWIPWAAGELLILASLLSWWQRSRRAEAKVS